MKLSVPTNWDPTLPDRLSGFPVHELFGSLPAAPVGSGRAKITLPKVSAEQAERHVADVHAKGYRFNYLLNAPCLGNLEYHKAYHAQLREHFAWIESIGADSVTVTIPYLVRLLKTQFPRLHVKVSVIAGVDNLQMLRHYQDMGADEINVDYMCNRDFRKLRALRKAARCELSLLVNDLCLFNCPHRLYHYNLTGHSTQSDHPLQGAYFDTCMVNCTITKLTHPEELIRSRWIRPEDLGRYETMGFERFKLSGRNMSTSWIVRAVEAYAKRSFSGNLGEILCGAIPEPTAAPHFRIDNGALNGFLAHFETKDCATECDACGYCQGIAEQAVTFPQGPKTAIYLQSYRRLLAQLETSELFRD